MKLQKGKQSRLLPNRSAMNTIAKSGRTINDYAKVSPLTAPGPAVMMQNWRGADGRSKQ